MPGQNMYFGHSTSRPLGGYSDKGHVSTVCTACTAVQHCMCPLYSVRTISEGLKLYLPGMKVVVNCPQKYYAQYLSGNGNVLYMLTYLQLQTSRYLKGMSHEN